MGRLVKIDKMFTTGKDTPISSESAAILSGEFCVDCGKKLVSSGKPGFCLACGGEPKMGNRRISSGNCSLGKLGKK